MHYKNGREAKNGDKVVLIPAYGGHAVAGILYDAVPENDSCNGRIAVTYQNDPYANMAETLHIDDVKAFTIPDASTPPPGTSGSVAVASILLLFLFGFSASAQTNSPTIPNLLGPLPSGASLPAFNSAGLSFTNANYKFATGSHFDSSGGVLNYLQADADFYHGSFVDLGAGANGTLSATGTGLHSAAVFGELIKNFVNFQFVAKAGGGINIDETVGYGAEVAEINYNLSPITGGWLAGNGFFTYVGGNIEGDEGNFKTGGKFQKQINIYPGISF